MITPIQANEARKRMGKMERRRRKRGDKPTLEELRACYHRIWTSQVGTEGYNKHDWQELSKMLYRKGLPV